MGDLMMTSSNKKASISTSQQIPLSYATLTKEQFDSKIQKGFADFDKGRFFTTKEVQVELLKRR